MPSTKIKGGSGLSTNYVIRCTKGAKAPPGPPEINPVMYTHWKLSTSIITSNNYRVIPSSAVLGTRKSSVKMHVKIHVDSRARHGMLIGSCPSQIEVGIPRNIIHRSKPQVCGLVIKHLWGKQ